jgi:phosphoglycerol geranylgeranyltransferase
MNKEALFIALIDPDRLEKSEIAERVRLFQENGVDLLFVGGSLSRFDDFDGYVRAMRAEAQIPVVGFPGSTDQISGALDAILYLSVISGRNPDLLFGQHVQIASQLKSLGMDVLSTGYMLVESGPLTSAHYVSHSLPIPRGKPSIAVSTALAAEYMGMSLIYLDAGSGASMCVPEEMISLVRDSVGVPLIVGGGICSPEMAGRLVQAGASAIVIGTGFEENPSQEFVRSFADAVHSA